MPSPFLLALCQPGAERALKAEAQRAGYVGAFQRPGIVTFKRSEGDAGELDVDAASAGFPSIYARYFGLSLGRVDSERLPLPEDARRLHVVSVDEERAADADALRARLVREPAYGFRESEDAKGPELVATVVLVDDARWLALHRAHRARTPFPGGRPRITLPPEAPSRAWLKLEEAVRLFSIPFAAGERALELGSAPGGASWALLQRGLEVVGVDPNDMDPRVASHEKLAHIRATSMSVKPQELERYDWLIVDVNVPARTALNGAIPFLREDLRGFVVTLKLKDWAMAAEVEGHVARLQHPAFDVVARQLWSNGQEICVVGLHK